MSQSGSPDLRRLSALNSKDSDNGHVKRAKLPPQSANLQREMAQQIEKALRPQKRSIESDSDDDEDFIPDFEGELEQNKKFVKYL